MKEIILEDEEKIIKAFDHSMYKVVFTKGDGSRERQETTILARNVVTLIKMIDKFKPHGLSSNYVLEIINLGVCNDVYVGDLYKY